MVCRGRGLHVLVIRNIRGRLRGQLRPVTFRGHRDRVLEAVVALAAGELRGQREVEPLLGGFVVIGDSLGHALLDTLPQVV